jgi:hypothetical protein
MRTTKATKWTLPEHTVGVDLGDRKSAICRLDAAGDVVDRRTISTTRLAFEAFFRAISPSRVVLEVGNPLPLAQPPSRGAGARGDRRQPVEDPRQEGAP